MEIKNLSVDIIIPVYNCRNFIDRCLKSILDQKCQEKLRIILVDDGSTDGSSKIVDNYADNFQNIIAIHKKNGGLSSARNAGMNRIKGDYFTFIDPDDWVEKSYFDKAIRQLKKNHVDILMVPYIRYYDNAKIKHFVFGNKTVYFDKGQSRSIVLKRLYGLADNELSNPLTVDNLSPVWSKFYKTERFSKIRFTDKTEIYSEDLWFNIKCFIIADSSEFFNRTFYYYFKGNKSSIVHTFDKNMLKEYKNLYQRMLGIIDSNELDQTFRNNLRNRIILNELSILRNVTSARESFSFKKKKIKEIIYDPIFNLSFKNFNFKKLPISYRCFYLACKYHISFLIYIILILGEKYKEKINQ